MFYPLCPLKLALCSPKTKVSLVEADITSEEVNKQEEPMQLQSAEKDDVKETEHAE